MILLTYKCIIKGEKTGEHGKKDLTCHSDGGNLSGYFSDQSVSELRVLLPENKQCRKETLYMILLNRLSAETAGK